MSYGGSASSMMIDADSDDDAPQSARQKNMKTRGKKVDAAASAMRAAIMKTQLQVSKQGRVRVGGTFGGIRGRGRWAVDSGQLHVIYGCDDARPLRHLHVLACPFLTCPI